MLVRRVVVVNQMQFLGLGVSRSIWRRKSSHSTWRWRWAQREITEPSSVLIAANNALLLEGALREDRTPTKRFGDSCAAATPAGHCVVVGVPGVEPGMFTTWGRIYSPAVHTPCRSFASCSRRQRRSSFSSGVFVSSNLFIWRSLKCKIDIAGQRN